LGTERSIPTAPTKTNRLQRQVATFTNISRLKTIEAVPAYLFFSTLPKKKIR
jgi:hypothetical protein